MKNKHFLLLGGLVILLLFVGITDVEAQCAMCRSSVESNITNESSKIGLGLNRGILYLLSLPYLLIATLAFLWYRNSRLQKPKKFGLQFR